jgi:hypothetical protein
MWEDIKRIAIIILIISLFFNIYLIKKVFFTKPEVVYIDRPVEVIKYITKVEVIKVPVERPTGEAEALLKQIENATPKIDVEEFVVKRDEKDNFEVPESIKGKMQLAWLKYDLDIMMKAKVLYKKTYDLKLALLAGGAYNNAENPTIGDYTDMVLLWSPLKFWDFETNLGLGLKGFTITESYALYHNLDVQLGYGWAYMGKSSLVVGLSLRI